MKIIKYISLLLICIFGIDFIISKKKVLLLSISLGIYSYNLIPSKGWDIYYYFKLYNFINNYGYLELKKVYIKNSLDKGIYLYLVFLDFWKVNEKIINSFVVFIGYYFLIKLYKKRKNSEKKSIKVFLNIGFLLTIPYLMLYSGLRFGLGMLLFILSCNFYEKGFKKIWIFLLLLSGYFHISYLILIFAIVSFYFIKNKGKNFYYRLYYISIIFFILNRFGAITYIFEKSVIFLPEYLKVKILSYMSGLGNINFDQFNSWSTNLVYKLYQIPYYIFLLIFSIKPFIMNKRIKLTYYIFSILNFISYNSTIIRRFQVVIILGTYIFLLEDIKKSKKRCTIFLILFYTLIIISNSVLSLYFTKDIFL